jgi:hypothetical protein
VARFLPILLVLLLALGVFVADPVRRAGEMIDAASLRAVAGDAPPNVEGWILVDDPRERLPRAYPPHNEVTTRSASYVIGPFGPSPEAYVRVVVAQDCRDLLAYDPSHSMLAGGWRPVEAREHGGLWHSAHARRSALIDELVVLETAFVAPGRWGSDPAITSPANASGPGWPGAGAIVQVLLIGSATNHADAMRAEVRRLAERVADDLKDHAP